MAILVLVLMLAIAVFGGDQRAFYNRETALRTDSSYLHICLLISISPNPPSFHDATFAVLSVI
jgi:hypothetical protein